MASAGETLKAYWPIIVVAAGLVASGAVDNHRIQANAEEIDDISNSVDENEDAIEEIQRLLIRRQGEVELKVQRIETEQKSQGDDIDEVLRLLREITRGD